LVEKREGEKIRAGGGLSSTGGMRGQGKTKSTSLSGGCGARECKDQRNLRPLQKKEQFQSCRNEGGIYFRTKEKTTSFSVRFNRMGEGKRKKNKSRKPPESGEGGNLLR